MKLFSFFLVASLPLTVLFSSSNEIPKVITQDSFVLIPEVDLQELENIPVFYELKPENGIQAPIVKFKGHTWKALTLFHDEKCKCCRQWKP